MARRYLPKLRYALMALFGGVLAAPRETALLLRVDWRLYFALQNFPLSVLLLSLGIGMASSSALV